MIIAPKQTCGRKLFPRRKGAYDMMFSDRFSELLKESGITKYRLSKITGISQTTLGRWESGTQAPNIGAAAMLADVFEVSTDYLMGKTDEKKPRAQAGEKPPVTDDDIKFALFNGADNITDEMYEEVKSFAQFVQEKYKKGK